MQEYVGYLLLHISKALSCSTVMCTDGICPLLTDKVFLLLLFKNHSLAALEIPWGFPSHLVEGYLLMFNLFLPEECLPCEN